MYHKNNTSLEETLHNRQNTKIMPSDKTYIRFRVVELGLQEKTNCLNQINVLYKDTFQDHY